MCFCFQIQLVMMKELSFEQNQEFNLPPVHSEFLKAEFVFFLIYATLTLKVL